MFIEPGVLHDVVGILGNPPPTDSTFPFSGLRALRLCVLALNILHASRSHLSPLWGLGVWCMPPGYIHVAPLGLNTTQFAVGHPSYWLGYLAKYPMCCAIVLCSLSQEYCLTLLVSWVTQPLRIQPSRFPVCVRCVLALNFPYVSRYHLSPLWGFGCIWCMPRAINMPPLWG